MDVPSVMPNFVLWIVLGVLSVVSCGSIIGVIGTIFAFLAKSEWDRGDYAMSEKKFKTAKTLIIINYVLLGFVVVLYGFLFAVGAMH